jgi:hypothetical protein
MYRINIFFVYIAARIYKQVGLLILGMLLIVSMVDRRSKLFRKCLHLYQSTQRRIPEIWNHLLHCYENLNFHTPVGKFKVILWD